MTQLKRLIKRNSRSVVGVRKGSVFVPHFLFKVLLFLAQLYILFFNVQKINRSLNEVLVPIPNYLFLSFSKYFFRKFKDSLVV